MHTSPFWILLAILLGASVMGVLGALIAVPSAVLVSVIFEELVSPESKRPKPEPAIAPRQEREG